LILQDKYKLDSDEEDYKEVYGEIGERLDDFKAQNMFTNTAGSLIQPDDKSTGDTSEISKIEEHKEKLEYLSHQINKLLKHVDSANALNIKLGAELEEALEQLAIERAKNTKVDQDQTFNFNHQPHQNEILTPSDDGAQDI